MTRFAGYTAIFDKPDCDGHVVRKGAFSRVLKSRRLILLYSQHERGKVIGRITRIDEDQTGLFVAGEVMCRRWAIHLAEHGSCGLSFGYYPEASTISGKDMTDLELYEVSLCVKPKQPLARAKALPASAAEQP